nr:hypothetical protein [Bacteroides intestinalis]
MENPGACLCLSFPVALQDVVYRRGIPVWEIDIRDSIQPDMARVILIHGETGEVMMDSYE